MQQDLSLLKTLTVMLIEDEANIRLETVQMLSVFFAKVISCSNGLEAMSLFAQTVPDIIIADIKMPRLDGLAFTQQLRKYSSVPIILLTGLSDRETLLKAINIGVDGYLVKPVELESLLALLLSVLMRNHKIAKTYRFINGLTFNMQTEILSNEGQPIELGYKEKKLLLFFLNHPNSVLSKEKIMTHIWGYEIISDSAFKNLLGRLKQKIGETLIVTVKGSGWMLKV